MHALFIRDRSAWYDASDLMHSFGDGALAEAAARAARSRDDGNVSRFCHWRQIERIIASLGSGKVLGTVH